MSLHPTQAHPTQACPQAAPSPHAADAQAYIQVLQDLITMGADLARLVHHQATAHAQPPAPPAPAVSPEPLISLTAAFDRIARAIRRSITLARTLADPIQPAPDLAQPRAAARRRILREVEDAIQRTANDAAPPDAGRTADLTAELHDRLDAPDLDDDLATRPIPDIITEICRDLGLAARPGPPPWKRRTPADIQRLCARAATPQPGTLQPSAPQPSTPQSNAAPAPTRTAPQHPLDPDRPEPPPINLRPIPRPPASNGPPDDPAEAIATILRHPGLRTRWPPPADS